MAVHGQAGADAGAGVPGALGGLDVVTAGGGRIHVHVKLIDRAISIILRNYIQKRHRQPYTG